MSDYNNKTQNKYLIDIIQTIRNIYKRNYMKVVRNILGSENITLLLVVLFSVAIPFVVFGQNCKTMVYDAFHGQNPRNGEVFNKLLPNDSSSVIEINSKEIGDSTFKDKYGLILFSPTKTFLDKEKLAIVKYLQSGGSLLLIFDEERRTSLNGVGINDIIIPFGIEFTDDAPVRHNCGAIADSSFICAGKRELPYSGGRSIKGGNVISKVNYEGNYIHCAYLKTPAGGKIIVMSDGMAGLLLGRPDGERFSGTGPSDSKFWGKDSKVFMQEILQFMISK